MSHWVTLCAVLIAHLSTADAQFLGLADLRYCYMLDGILFFYAIIVTALFFREKLSKRGPVVGEEDGDKTYSKLQYRAQEHYDEIHKARDTEKGTNRMKSPENSVYHDLQRDKMNDPYSDIRVKQQPRRKGKGNDAVYQGLSGAQRDTYDALQMQALH
ncbi:T-cell surface glycoprotein CD3 zeta chain [Hyla sarda]|uniref:T-cell surface glycoprotein CD3 zeta chain n=1 Tax=Hyla sarda TaxID=327740 RepID=UPI0024C26D7B|nr:T-cell surface glycoprotein CD3 zeta chain [Hyla sarda]